ncbi:MAG TPA: formimidoylglutamate deiminase [Pyrinomonadaceae bacterium]|nr:formimidoylglutamate deiminase [Pyrinomonadaceae bacterium]
MMQAWLPDLVYTNGRFTSDVAVICDEKIVRLCPAEEAADPVRLKNQALLPGLVNAHSHAFQRVIRGRTERRSQSASDSFWTWREQMYAAANRLTPEEIYSASRMAFLEMALAGITAVGEFHYLHHAPDGSPYSDPNLLEREVIRAARDVGIRIALLRVAYARAGYRREPDPQQVRFIESSPDVYLKNLNQLLASPELKQGEVWVGVAPHSVRAVPLDYLKRIVEFANARGLVVHMHVAEQTAEVAACIEEYRRSPAALLDTEGLLGEKFTAVHAIHVTSKAVSAFARSGAKVCACPTTERNLGDGVVPVDEYFSQRVPVSLGTDSQIQIDLLEDARELEYHLRLQRMSRNVLATDNTDDTDESALARRLFECATTNGATSIGFAGGGVIERGAPADFFTVDLDDPSIAGSTPENLLANIVFSLSRTAVRDVVVGGKRIVADGRHAQQEEIVSAFERIQTTS